MSINDSDMNLASEFYMKHDYKELAVLDPFMGGGTSIIEARKINARTIGIDIDPIAWFTTKKEVDPFNRKEIMQAYKQLEESVGKKISSYYVTEVDGKNVPVTYYFWVDLITCPKCNNIFEAHPHYILSLEKSKKHQIVFCKYCHKVANISTSRDSFTCSGCHKWTKIKSGTIDRGKFDCPYCKNTDSILSIIKPGSPLTKRLFALEYFDNHKTMRQYKAADEFDINLYEQAQYKFEELKSTLPFPRYKIPTENRNDARPINFGFEYYYQLFNARQLLCLSLLWQGIQNLDMTAREYFVIAFSDSLASNNMLCRYAFGYQKLTPLFGIHAYDVIHRPVENNTWGTKFGRGSFSKCFNKMVKGKEYSEKPFEYKYEKYKPTRIVTSEKISTDTSNSLNDFINGATNCALLNQSSVDLDLLPESCIDLILTDPPYYDNLSYSELSDFFYVWIRDYMPKDGNGCNHISTPYQKALFAKNNSPDEKFVKDLTIIFKHCHRVLKNDGLMVFTFHHRRLQAWISLGKALRNSGFYPTNIFPVRSEGNSGFHSTEGTIKWDSVIVCRNHLRLHRDQLTPNNVIPKVCYWEDRLKKAALDFRPIDSLSLGYAILLQSSIAQSSDSKEMEKLMKASNDLLLERFRATLKT
jgi:adenine-specific DNA methylase